MRIKIKTKPQALISIDSSTYPASVSLSTIRVVPGGNMKLHIKYLIKACVLHDNWDEAAAANSLW